MSTHLDRLNATKSAYPFQGWAESGLEQYTGEVCGAFAAIIDRLIADLASRGESAPEAEKLDSFREAILALNALDEDDDSLIEADEREDLLELCKVVAVAAGLDPAKYGGGEGPASERGNW